MIRRLLLVLLFISGALVATLSLLIYFALFSQCPSEASPANRPLEVRFAFDAAEVERTHRILVLVPGALNSVSIFAGLDELKSEGFALIHYRQPGMDGRPLDAIVRVREAANDIAVLAQRFPGKPIDIVGFSLGGQIALEAAIAMPSRISHVVVLAGSTGFPETFSVGLRAVRWVAERAWSEKTTDFAAIWKSFYKVLLYGARGVTDAKLSARADTVVASRRSKIVTPTLPLVCSHMRDAAFRKPVLPDSVGDVQVLFVHGKVDIVTTVSSIQAYSSKFPNARLEILPDQGHLLFLTDTDLAKRIRKFLAEAPR